MKARIPAWAIVLALLLVLVVPGLGAAVVVATTEEQRKVRQAAQRQGPRFGVSGEIIEALGYVESRWRMSAVNKSGADGARGGSWGPFQLSEKTARAYGYTGRMEAFTEDADLAAEWCARILAKRPGGAPRSVEDAAAWWNAGRSSADAPNLPASTRDDYIPKALSALAKVQASPVEVA